MIHIDAIACQSRYSQIYTKERITFILACLIGSVLLNNPVVYLILFVISLLYILTTSRQKLGTLMKIMRVPLLFVWLSCVLIAITFSFKDTPNALFQIKFSTVFIALTKDSLSLALEVFIRSVSTILQVFSISLTIPMAQVIQWMNWLRLPKSFVQLFTMSYRMIFIVYESAQELSTSQTLRFGFLSPIRSFKTVIAISKALFMTTFDKMNDMDVALKLRCFDED